MSSWRKALILGGTGQDGAHLAAHLLNDGWQVFVGFRRGSGAKTWRLQHLGVLDRVTLVNVNIDEPLNLFEVMQSCRPDHIYHLAGESFVADSFLHPVTTLQANSSGTLHVLEAMRQAVPDARMFFASSSEVFEQPQPGSLLNEESPIRPANPYGVSKLAAQHLVRVYRENHGMHVMTGLLFNHEGVLRGRNFVTRKITYNLARVKAGGGDGFMLGSMSSLRDWGAAEDYTFAMYQSMLLDRPDDYVFATGTLTSVRDFLRIAAEAIGMDVDFEGSGIEEVCLERATGRIVARVNAAYVRPHDTGARAGDSSKLKQATGWEGSRPVRTLAREMAQADLSRREQGITDV